MIYFLNLLLLIIISNARLICGQNSPLMSGPMLGYTEMRETQIWLQTRKAAAVHLEYWLQEPIKYANAPSNNSEHKILNTYKRFTTETIETFANDAFTAKFTLTDLEPGNKYEYEIFIDGQKVQFTYSLFFQTLALWQHRTPAPDFRFALGSCAYINDSTYDRPGAPYGKNYRIFDAIKNNKPDFMIWGGDNVYLREADYYSRSGILYRYTHTRATPELQSLLASCHHYAIWDDHDYGPNDSDRSYRNKNQTLEAFKLFWANPSFGVGDNSNNQGITTTFEWGDAQFFLLDNRFFRTANKRQTFTFEEKQTILGKTQLSWLIDALKYSRANFKFIVMGGQFINPAKVYETYNNLASEERQYLIDAIKTERISGVFFLSGDRHHTELSVIQDNDFYPLYDLTVSPLTSSTSNQTVDENNSTRVPGTWVAQHNFALLDIVGNSDNRRVIISIVNADGVVEWTRVFNQKDFYYHKQGKY